MERELLELLGQEIQWAKRTSRDQYGNNTYTAVDAPKPSWTDPVAAHPWLVAGWGEAYAPLGVPQGVPLTTIPNLGSLGGNFVWDGASNQYTISQAEQYWDGTPGLLAASAGQILYPRVGGSAFPSLSTYTIAAMVNVQTWSSGFFGNSFQVLHAETTGGATGYIGYMFVGCGLVTISLDFTTFVILVDTAAITVGHHMLFMEVDVPSQTFRIWVDGNVYPVPDLGFNPYANPANLTDAWLANSDGIGSLKFFGVMEGKMTQAERNDFVSWAKNKYQSVTQSWGGAWTPCRIDADPSSYGTGTAGPSTVVQATEHSDVQLILDYSAPYPVPGDKLVLTDGRVVYAKTVTVEHDETATPHHIVIGANTGDEL